MIKTLKNFGVLCAVESVVAFTFLIAAGMCAGVGAIDGVVVSLLVAGGALALGVSRYRTLTAVSLPSLAERERELRITVDDFPEIYPKPKRNRAKPAPAKPRKVTKRPKSKK